SKELTMHRNHVASVVVSLFLASARLGAAQSVDPTGHWEGTAAIQDNAITFEVDLMKNGNGELVGTIGVPAQHVQGLPLTKIAVNGTALDFHARTDQTFRGKVLDDGTSWSGDFSIEGYAIPLKMTKTGEAHVAPAPKSAAIAKPLEGIWNGGVQGATAQKRL